MSNGYKPSLFGCEDGVCYVTGWSGYTARHEIFNKHARQYSKEDGLWITVLPEVHEMIHANYQGMWDKLKEEAEMLWLLDDYDRSINDFIERYGRNYLWHNI